MCELPTTAELVSTGAELLSGRSVNTHAQLLGGALRRLGIELVRDTTVPDGLDVIQEAVQAAVSRTDLVFVSGGLGPTNDDVTRDAVARLFGRDVVMHEPSLQAMRDRFARSGRPVHAARERQALVVEGAEALINPAGIAPGARVEQDGKIVFMLPGPPREFEAILNTHVLPWLAQRAGATGATRERIFMVCGIGESDVVQRFEAEGFPPDGIETAYCASTGRVEVRLHPAPGIGDEILDRAALDVVRLLGEHVYATERIELDVLVGRLLKESGQTLATAESCTGGLIGERITSVPGSSVYYRGGVIAYANEIKMALLGVCERDLEREGAVSEGVAVQMAEGVRLKFHADFGLSVTGIAGPGGGTEEKPVGLVYIGVASPCSTHVTRHIFPGDRSVIRQWTCQTALKALHAEIVAT